VEIPGKTLLLLRHAKSDWDADSGDDHDRPLARRGLRAARRVGAALTALGRAPDAVLTSSALRARRTAELAAEAGGWRAPVEVDGALYLSPPAAVLERVRQRQDAAASLLVVGHEPTWSGLVEELTGARVRLPTAAVARIDLDIGSWGEIRPGGGTLIWLLTPKVLQALGR
jgi:phosphohistidine phosphatase